MWQDLGGLGGVGVNSGAHQVDQFGTTELTPEQQKILIDIRRKKTELLLEIQISDEAYLNYTPYLGMMNE
ncbi:hypothetical protein DMN91_010021 [Ooceraea biroi]|uniref:Uncharacterized protein n=1 Tax=Ooceraea biroi TaxID=2015173 RepID=A0A3L8DBR7_OOCBI|nr:hypothetical protein DMN91_010021 [Ooceraea biroi]